MSFPSPPARGRVVRMERLPSERDWMPRDLATLIEAYKADPESVYNTWFVEDGARTKAFRSIRRGVQEVVAAARERRFGNDFKGSPLEFVLSCITEQKQVFEGAAHPFY